MKSGLFGREDFSLFVFASIFVLFSKSFFFFFFYIYFNEYARAPSLPRAASLPRKATHAVMFRNNMEVILNTPTAITVSLQLH